MARSGRPPVSANEERLANIFSESNYIEIPRFQRSYAWDVDEYSTFWQDIRHTIDGPKERIHFLGAIVFARHASRPALFALDGQQRLTTLMLLVAAMQDVVKQHPALGSDGLLVEDLASALRLTVSIEGRSQRVPRLKSNRQDRDFFQHLISAGTPLKPQHDSHRLMGKAYAYLYAEVRRFCEDHDDVSAAMWKLWNGIRDRFWYIDIVCEEEINAQAVFESLNAKGEDLSTADLIKNFLFMDIESEKTADDVDEADRLWSQMVTELGRDSWLPNYVHAYWSSKFSYTREDEIYRELKTLLGRRELTSWAFLKGVASEAETYAEIRNPSQGFWRSQATTRMLREMRSLNIRVTHGVLLALKVAHEDDASGFEESLRRLLNFMVRYSKITEQPTNRVDASFSDWARALRSGKSAPTEFDDWLRTEAPSREMFIESFKALKVKSGPTARYLLMKINNALNKGNEPESMVADSELVTLEHVIPQSPDEGWKSYLHRNNIQLEDVVHRIGNLTLLTGPKNSTASNHSFTYKRDKIYAVSSLPINLDLVSTSQSLPPRDPSGGPDDGGRTLLEEFGLRELNSRQERLAYIAERVWTVEG